MPCEQGEPAVEIQPGTATLSVQYFTGDSLPHDPGTVTDVLFQTRANGAWRMGASTPGFRGRKEQNQVGTQAALTPESALLAYKSACLAKTPSQDGNRANDEACLRREGWSADKNILAQLVRLWGYLPEFRFWTRNPGTHYMSLLINGLFVKRNPIQPLQRQGGI